MVIYFILGHLWICCIFRDFVSYCKIGNFLFWFYIAWYFVRFVSRVFIFFNYLENFLLFCSVNLSYWLHKLRFFIIFCIGRFLLRMFFLLIYNLWFFMRFYNWWFFLHSVIFFNNYRIKHPIILNMVIFFLFSFLYNWRFLLFFYDWGKIIFILCVEIFFFCFNKLIFLRLHLWKIFFSFFNRRFYFFR